MTAMTTALRIPRVRWGIGVLLGAGVLINYFDRINLSVGAPQLQQEFGLTDGELGHRLPRVQGRRTEGWARVAVTATASSRPTASSPSRTLAATWCARSCTRSTAMCR
jgi:hypothetical protein